MDYKVEIVRDLKEDRIETDKIDQIIFLGLILIISFLPVIMRAKLIDFTSPIITFENLMITGNQGDLYTYYKFVFLFTITAIIFGLFLYRTFVLGNSLVNHKSQYIFLSFIVIVALSVVTSPYTSIALFGMYNRHDGALTTVLVVILFFIASNLTYSKKRLLIISYAFAPAVILNLVFSLSLFYGSDWLQKEWIQKLIVPSSIGTDALVSGSQLWTTINNPNYASGYAGFVTMMFLALALFIKEWYHKLGFFVLSLAAFVLMLTSLSSSGFLAITVTIIFLLLVIIKFRNFKTTIPIFLLALVLFFSSIYVLQDRNQRIWTETFGLFNIENPFLEKKEETLSNLQPVQSKFYSAINFSSVAYADDTVEEREIKLPEFPQPGVSAGSGRIYIWDRTASLILERPLLGYGLDTIIYTFPQYDPEKQAGLRSMSTMVDKPHNIFIGIAYGSGIFALLAFLIGFLVIAWSGIKVFWKHQTTNTLAFVAAFLAACLAFLVQGLVNDAIIGSYPLFWLLLGVTVSVINQLKVSEE